MIARLRRFSRLTLALRFVWQSAPRLTVAQIGLILLQGPLPLLSLYLTKLMIDELTAGLEAGRELGALVQQVGLLVVLTAGVSILVAAINMVATLVKEAQSLTVTDYMHDIIHAKSIAVDLAYYEDPRYYDTLRRAQQEAAFRPLRILNGLMQVFQSSVSLVALAGLLLALHWSVGVLLFVAVIPSTMVRLYYSRRLYNWQRQRTETQRQAMYYSWMLTSDQHAKEIRLFDLGPLFIRRFRELRELVRHEQLGISIRRAVMTLLTQVGSTVVLYGSYGFIAYQTIRGETTIGDLVVYYQAFQQGQNYMRNILNGLTSLYEDTLFLTNLYEFLDLEPQIEEPEAPHPVPQPIQAGIVFDKVSFQYPGTDRMALRDVSLTIRPRETVALIGANGSGKTTLIKLMCRLYDPASGQITIDGAPLAAFSTADLRREFSVIFQDYTHYNLSVRENIWLGKTDLPPDDERVVEAARQSGADAVIQGLQAGYDTQLGKWFAQGEELSIGEWQKIALARAFVRDAQVIILDEPTSALDARAEYKVFQELRRLTAQHAMIIISHRFSTVRMADRIYVIEDGVIVEGGSHDELMAQDGVYAKLFALQAQWYQPDDLEAV